MSTPAPALRRTCDIVMKGGITSGVVYPRAITALSRRFTFKNIGGTSAGAIAAAAAAAAEYRRSANAGGDDAGFQTLDRLPAELGTKPGAGTQTLLSQFFQPNARTRRVFAIGTYYLGGASFFATVLFTLGSYIWWALLGALPGLGVGLGSARHLAQGRIVWVWLALSVLLAVVGAATLVAIRLYRDVTREIPRNHYGLCRGLADASESASARFALTTWLTAYLNQVAGLAADAPPLRFEQLWGTHESDQEKAPRLVNLEMMTTNLTHGRPYRLPFRDDPDLHENTLFYFRRDEFENFFPAPVVAWMLDHPRSAGNNPARLARRQRLAAKGFYPLPAPADLPVVVATRMSLSFPILLSAVPLHTIDRSVFGENEQPERCWFSDGGICSNFPLHFFDTALPRRPTFSIDLAEKPADTPPADLHPTMPEGNDQDLAEHWNRFDTEIPTQINEVPAAKSPRDSLVGFFGAAIATMQNWTDTTQSRLPGYRDRIVTVPLTSNEGGLNLNMPTQRITDLSDRGIAAATLLAQHFDVPPHVSPMTWDNHRWIRLRSFLASFEKSLAQLVAACDAPENNDRAYEPWLDALKPAGTDDAHPDEKAPSYAMNQAQLTAARATLAKLREIRGAWSASPAAGGAPRPRPILRPRAQI